MEPENPSLGQLRPRAGPSAQQADPSPPGSRPRGPVRTLGPPRTTSLGCRTATGFGPGRGRGEHCALLPDWQEHGPILRAPWGEGRGRAASRAPGGRGTCSRELAARAGRLPRAQSPAPLHLDPCPAEPCEPLLSTSFACIILHASFFYSVLSFLRRGRRQRKLGAGRWRPEDAARGCASYARSCCPARA